MIVACLWNFETFSAAVEWIAHNKLKIDYILHLLDDLLLVAPSEQLCQQQLDLFLSLCSYVGIPIAPEKTCGPATSVFCRYRTRFNSVEGSLAHGKN